MLLHHYLFLPYFEDKHRKAIQKTTGLSPVHIVLRAKQSENRLLSLKTLVEDFKFYPDCGSNSGVRPLQRAIEQGDIEVVEFLLETGKVNINSQDCRGNTPLHYAVKHGYEKIVTCLLDHNININSQTENNLTPLHYATLITLKDCPKENLPLNLIEKDRNKKTKTLPNPIPQKIPHAGSPDG